MRVWWAGGEGGTKSGLKGSEGVADEAGWCVSVKSQTFECSKTFLRELTMISGWKLCRRVATPNSPISRDISGRFQPRNGQLEFTDILAPFLVFQKFIKTRILGQTFWDWTADRRESLLWLNLHLKCKQISVFVVSTLQAANFGPIDLKYEWQTVQTPWILCIVVGADRMNMSFYSSQILRGHLVNRHTSR